MRLKRRIKCNTLLFTGKPNELPSDCISEKPDIWFTSAVIPNSVTTVCDRVFQRRYSLTAISIPNSVCNLGAWAFSSTAISSVHIPNSIKHIDMMVLYGCSALTSVHIPNSVKSINRDSFCNCTSLASVCIPNSIETIGRQAFSGCSAMTSVHTPTSVKTLESGVFAFCYNLASIYLSHSIKGVGIECFYYCEHLHKVVLAQSAKIDFTPDSPSFLPETALLRPRLKPIRLLQKKTACRASKASYSIFL